MKKFNKNKKINISKVVLLTSFALAATVPLAPYAMAADFPGLPSTSSTPSSNVTIITTADTAQVLQKGQVGYIEYNSYNVDAGKSVLYGFNTPGSISINKVVGPGATSYINGNIGKFTGSYNGTDYSTGSGHVLLINPNGIIFGAGANINLEGFTASTHNTVQLDGNVLPIPQNTGITSTTAWSSVALSGLSNYGIYVAPSATLKASSGNLNLVSNAVKNEGILEATNGSAMLVNANSFTINNNSTGNTISASVPYNPTTVNVNGSNATAGIVSTGSVKGKNVLIKSAYNAPSPEDIINLSGVVMATAGDITVDSSNSSFSNNTLFIDSTASNNVKISSGTNLSATGTLKIKTSVDNATSDAHSGNITFGNASTINAANLTLNTSANTSAGNATGGDVKFEDGTDALHSTISANLTTVNTLAIGSTSAKAGKVTIGSYTAIVTAADSYNGDFALVLNTAAGTDSGNATGGVVAFNGHNRITDSTNLGIEHTEKAISLSGTSTDGILDFGNNSTIESTGGSVDIESEYGGAFGYNTTGIKFGDGNEIKGSTGVEITTGFDGVMHSGAHLVAGNVSFGSGNKIESDNGDIYIEAISRGSSSGVASATAGNVLLGNNNIIQASQRVFINANADTGGTSGAAKGGNVITGYGNNITSLTDDIRINVSAQGDSGGGQAGNIIIDRSNLTTLQGVITLAANSEVYGKAAKGGNVILYGSTLTAPATMIAVDSVGYGNHADCDTAGKINVTNTRFNGIDGQNSLVAFFTKEGIYANDSLMHSSMSSDILTNRTYYIKNGATFNPNVTAVTTWDSLPSIVEYNPSSQPSAPETEHFIARDDSTAAALHHSGIEATSESVGKFYESTSGVFGEEENVKNSSNANSGNPEIAEAIAEAPAIANNVSENGLEDTIKFADGFQSPAAPATASSAITVGPEVPVSNTRPAATDSQMPQMQQQPAVGHGRWNAIRHFFH